MDRIIIDQAKIKVDENLVRRGAPPFPRPLTWWQRTVPIWVDVSEAEDGRIVLTPNGKRADGYQYELTPAVVHQEIKAIVKYLGDRRYLDFSDACSMTRG
ncbi:hypothetical protein [Streptomyces africanus]|uniref:hypothetical protein n=1 Tax=Streptomyces africanus TaxID=231024 RepID=UPI000A3A5167|nr:hypothetical protein [Streptomyces africanus]